MNTPFWIVTAAKKLEQTGIWRPYVSPAMNSYVGAQIAAEMMDHQHKQFADVSIIGPFYTKLPEEK